MSSSPAEDLFIRGVAAAQANDKDEARFYLEWALREWDMYSEIDYDKQADAYFWLSRVSDDPKQKREYLEQVLAIIPAHPEARRDLAILDGRLKPADIVNPDNVGAPIAPTSNAARRYVCPQCGGKLAYDVATRALTCEYCGYHTSEDEAQVAGAIIVGDFGATLYTARAHRWESATARTLACQSCGANFTLPLAQVTGECPFCGSAHIVESNEGRELIEPSGVVPFQFDRDAAIQYLREWSAQHFRKDDLKHATFTRPRPVYLPFWSFDMGGEVRWREDIAERRERDGKIVRVQRDGNGLVLQDDLLVLASHSLPAALANALTNPATSFDRLRMQGQHGERHGYNVVEPSGQAYNLKSLAPYSENFLADWPAEIYQISLADASLAAHQRTFEAGKQRIQRTLDARELSFDSTGIIINTYRLVLLPVWVTEFSYKDKSYPLVVNGQTGSVHGDVPRGGWQKLVAGILS